MCGEKNSIFCPVFSVTGSPPRVRGKAPRPSPSRPSRRITPACAGKRPRFLWQPGRLWDHPRVCGEKPRFCGQADLVRGSPPRVRGKAACRGRTCNYPGITPACAGKSSNNCRSTSEQQDHPRVCGEKALKTDCVRSDPGSPPRVRGKGGVASECTAYTGITPACAGKSSRNLAGRHIQRDHPRVCGEKRHTVP